MFEVDALPHSRRRMLSRRKISEGLNGKKMDAIKEAIQLEEISWKLMGILWKIMNIQLWKFHENWWKFYENQEHFMKIHVDFMTIKFMKFY